MKRSKVGSRSPKTQSRPRAAPKALGARRAAKAKTSGSSSRPKSAKAAHDTNRTRSATTAKRGAKPKRATSAEPAAKPKGTAKPQRAASAKPAAKPKRAASAKAAAKPKGTAKPQRAASAKPAANVRRAGSAKNTAGRSALISESKVASQVRSAKTANANGKAPRKKPRIIDVLQRDAPISLPMTAYESEVLAVLASEEPSDNHAEANTKIAERLRAKCLGELDAQRVELLRSFKCELADELRRGRSSPYFTGSHGLYAAPEDFDHSRLAEDFSVRYPAISHEAVAAFVPIAVYCYYLR